MLERLRLLVMTNLMEMSVWVRHWVEHRSHVKTRR
jgi:hypothetical protein